MEALANQVAPTQYAKILRELHKNFTTKMSPFHSDINIDVKRGVGQGVTISPKLFTVTLQNVMRTLEWDNMGVKVDGRQLQHISLLMKSFLQ
uniref:Reverse transcriptase domain-containing protein n=1 Tax=Angiostrongylus cantonensis TaxID=6313 RepID=A0A0K0DLX1_ANGCA